MCGEGVMLSPSLFIRKGREVKTPRNSQKPTGGDLSEGPEGQDCDLPQPPEFHRPCTQQPLL